MAVTLQQAATNAFVKYLKTQLPDINIFPRWPRGNFPGRAITVLQAGHRRVIPLDPRVLSKTNLPNNQTRVVWQIGHCTQPYQLDVWADSELARDDIMARLDDALHAGQSSLTGVSHRDPVGHGCSIRLADGWETTETIADFSFNEPDLIDEPETVSRSQYRATYRGEAYMMLTVKRTSARQAQITLKALLNGDTSYTDSLVT